MDLGGGITVEVWILRFNTPILGEKSCDVKKTLIIQDLNFYRRLVDLKIVPAHPNREAPVALLRKVKELDLSDARIRSVEELVYFDRLQTLNLLNNRLEELDLSQNTALRTVLVSGKKLRRLELGDLKKLHCLHVGGPLEQLMLPEGNELFELSVTDTKLRLLDLSVCKELRVLNVSRNRLTHLDISAQSLIYLNVKGNRLKKLDLTGQLQLEYVNAIGNQLRECVCSATEALQFLLLEDNPMDTEQLQKDPAFSHVKFTDPHPMRRDTYQWYVTTALIAIAEEERRCVAGGASYHFCADMMKGSLYTLLRKYDSKRRLYRYERGMIVLTFPVIGFLNFMYQDVEYPKFRAEELDYSEEKRTYFQEASALGLDDFPDQVVLMIRGRSVTFDADEVALTSDQGFPNEMGWVRYIERITGKVRAQRAVVIWND